MKFSVCLSLLASSLALLRATTVAAAPQAAPGESFADLTTDGGWCWFSDPRALASRDHTYVGWLTEDGSVVVGDRDDRSGHVSTQVLHPKYERDDHDNPALLELPDGRLAAFYSRHANGDMELRITERPRDLSAWSVERSLGFVAPERGRRGTTYANPVLLSEEGNSLYVFWRGSDFKPTFALSHDLGATWSRPTTLLSRPGADDTNRPYLKLASDARGRIDFVFTDGHPRNEPTNSVHFVRYEHGAFFKADGTRLGGLSDLPLDPARCDRVYDGTKTGRGWIWDIAATADGRPVIAFTRLPAEDDHRYAVATWDDGAWRVTEICPAGRWFPQTPAGKTEPEPHYSGGMALDHADPFTLYTSRRIDGVFEIEQWQSHDHGQTWQSRPITAHSRHDNVRPFVVRRTGAGAPALLWLNVERYVHYTDFRTRIKSASLPADKR